MSKPRVISLCAGAGIGEIGIADHFDTVLAVDSWWRACVAHMQNQTGVRCVHADIRDAGLREWARENVGTVDGIIATPPCPSFSQAGPRKPKHTDTATFESVLDWVRAFATECVIVENVIGLRRSPVLKRFIAALKEQGYQAVEWILNASSFGVPQHRRRLFLIATKVGTLQPEPPNPTHGLGLLPYRNLRDAIGDLTEAQALALGCAPLSVSRAALMAQIPPGENWSRLPDEERERVIASCGGKKPHPRICRRYEWSDTPLAVLTGPHVQRFTAPLPPHVNRPFSVAEYLRIQGVTRPFQVFGNLKERYRQVGNGVPPALMSAVCGAVAASVRKGSENIFTHGCGILQKN